MQSVLANLRLAGGCWALFLGILMLAMTMTTGEPGGLTTPRFWGVVIGGAGLAVTLREFAAMVAVFMRGKPDAKDGAL